MSGGFLTLFGVVLMLGAVPWHTLRDYEGFVEWIRGLPLHKLLMLEAMVATGIGLLTVGLGVMLLERAR